MKFSELQILLKKALEYNKKHEKCVNVVLTEQGLICECEYEKS